MEEELNLQENYAGVEPVDVGNLDEVKEIKTVIPASKNVLVEIKKAEVKINQANTYRSINLQLQLLNGIDVDGKYKGKVVFGRVCYFADPTVYTKDFFKAKQHLIGLKQLKKALGIETNLVDGHFVDSLAGQKMKIDIIVKKRNITVEGTQIEVMENDVRNFKGIDPTELV